MKNQRYADAELVYREDLSRLPDNGWGLYGLAASLRAQGKDSDQVKAIDAKFQKIWARSDTEITSSCLCQPGKTL